MARATGFGGHRLGAPSRAERLNLNAGMSPSVRVRRPGRDASGCARTTPAWSPRSWRWWSREARRSGTPSSATSTPKSASSRRQASRWSVWTPMRRGHFGARRGHPAPLVGAGRGSSPTSSTRPAWRSWSATSLRGHRSATRSSTARVARHLELQHPTQPLGPEPLGPSTEASEPEKRIVDTRPAIIAP